MDMVQEYRRRARECRALAEAAVPSQAIDIRNIAETWERLAIQRERLVEAEQTKKPTDPTHR
jgi:hypothetical protein